MAIVASRSRQIHELLARLGSPQPSRREAAVARLTLIGERAVPALVDWMKAAEPTGRLAGLEVLGRLPEARAASLVVGLVGDPDPAVALRAIELAAEHPGPGAAAELSRVARQGRAPRRRAAVEALCRLHRGEDLEAMEALLELLVDEAADVGLRVRALQALAGSDRKALRPVLRRLRNSGSPELRRHLTELEAGPRRKPSRSPGPERLVKAWLSEPGEREARRRLLAALEEDRAALDWIHRVLDETDEPSTLRALIELLQDNRSPASLPRLHDLVRRLAEGPHSPERCEVRARAHLALAALDSRIALYDLRELLPEAPVECLPLLLSAAGRVGDASLLPALARRAAADEHAVDACAVALGSIIERERLRRSSRAVKAVPAQHQHALDLLWKRARARPSR
jgi:hypothetical protein